LSTQHETTKRINDGTEQLFDQSGDVQLLTNDRITISNEVEANYSAVNNKTFLEKKENGAVSTRPHTTKINSSSPRQVSDSEDSSDSNEDEDDNLEEYMTVYLQTGEVDQSLRK
jgi:hypothetical protein